MKSNAEPSNASKTNPIDPAKDPGKSTTAENDAAPSTGVNRYRQAVSGSGRANEPEEDQWRGGYSPKDMIGVWVLMGFASVAALGVALWVYFAFEPPFMTVWFWVAFAVVLVAIWGALVIRCLLLRWTIDYRLTSQRLIHIEGIFRRVSDRVEVIDMDDIAFHQGLLQRMMGVGDITILSTDQSHPKLVMRGIDNVTEVAAKLDAARRKERVRRGVHVEQV